MNDAGDRTGAETTAALRRDRDRFVSFAFAGADVLIELGTSHRINFVAGASQTLFGEPSDKLVGRNFLDVVRPEDREVARLRIAATDPGRRVPEFTLSLADGYGGFIEALVAGYRPPGVRERYYLAVSHRRLAEPGVERSETARDPDSGLLSADAFATLAAHRAANGAGHGTAERVVMFDLPVMNGLSERLGRDEAMKAVRAIGEVLCACSADGDSAARIGEFSFCLLADGSLAVRDLEGDVAAAAEGAVAGAEPVSVRSLELSFGDVQTSRNELKKTFEFVLRGFVNGDRTVEELTNLADAYDRMVKETVARVSTLKHKVASNSFRVALQPIVDLANYRIHHHEALTRFLDNAPHGSPHPLILLAEEAGVIADFDLAVVERVLATIHRADAGGKFLSVAVNLSGYSISSPAFVKALENRLAREGLARGRLLFEITESAAIRDLGATNAAIQQLRRAGYMICLDDFGAGAAAFQYLRALEVDIVKIDGVYVREYRSDRKGAAFLRAMTSLCHDLGMEVVAEMVEEKATAQFLKQCGVRFGQGYLFGGPTLRYDPIDEGRDIVPNPDRAVVLG